MRGPAATTAWIIDSFSIESTPRSVADVIIEYGNAQNWFTSAMEAEQKAEVWAPAVIARLRRHLNRAREDWRPTRFDFNDSDSAQIQGACLVLPSDGDEVVAEKCAMRHIDNYRSAVRSLGPRQFEFLCGGLLELTGCTEPHVTPRSADQGIDFFGKLQTRGQSSRTFRLGGSYQLLDTWVVGQAKHYDGEVGPAEIREFAGAHFLASHGVSYDGGRALTGYKAAALQAKHLFFVTTGRLTRGTQRLIARAGIVVFDEERIAGTLAQHGVATANDQFDSDLLGTWLEGIAGRMTSAKALSIDADDADDADDEDAEEDEDADGDDEVADEEDGDDARDEDGVDD